MRKTGRTTQRRITEATRQCCKTCALVFGVFGISIGTTLFAQSVATRNRGASIGLRYRITVSKPVVCPGENLPLELKLRNMTAHNAVIDRLGLMYQVSISGNESGRSSTGDNLGKPLPDEFVTLRPGESYREKTDYALKDHSLRPGIYKIEVTYGQFREPSRTHTALFRGTVQSNTTQFQIKECSNGSH